MAFPGRVVDVLGEEAVVEVAGVARRVSLSFLLVEGTPVAPGDWILAGAGMAVRRIDGEEAVALLESLEEESL